MFTFLLLFCCQCIISNDNNNEKWSNKSSPREFPYPASFSATYQPPPIEFALLFFHTQDHQLKSSSAISNPVCEAVDSDVSVEINNLTIRI